MVAKYGLHETVDLIYNIKGAQMCRIAGLREAPGHEKSL